MIQTSEANNSNRETLILPFSRVTKNVCPIAPPVASRWWYIGLFGASLLTILLYIPSYRGPFVFDDVNNIVTNADVASFPPRLNWRHPESRPLVTLSFAINWVVFGNEPMSFRIVNVLLHVACGLLLAWLTRRLVIHWRGQQKLPTLDHSFYSEYGLAFLVSIIWLLHPLSSAAVAYIVQRSEIMASLSMLGFLCFIVKHYETGGKIWQVLAVAIFVAGVFCKTNTIAIIPVALLMDSLILVGSMRLALRQRTAVYLLPLATGITAALILLPDLLRGGAGVGLAAENATPLQYFATQCRVFWSYLGRCVWPAELSIDHRWIPYQKLTPALPWMVVTILTLALSIYLVWRERIVGWLILSVFLLLAPTSSFIPVTDVFVEYRMYLASAFVIALITIATTKLLMGLPYKIRPSRPFLAMVIFLLFIALSARTMLRAADWRTGFELWASAARSAPHSPRALQNLTQAADQEGRRVELLKILRELFIKQNRCHENSAAIASRLGEELIKSGDSVTALPLLHHAIADLDPSGPVDERREHAAALVNLATLYLKAGQLRDAEAQLVRAVQVDSQLPFAFAMLGQIAMQNNQPKCAVGRFLQAIALQPDWPEVERDLAQARKLSSKLKND